MRDGFVRIACVTPSLTIANPSENAARIVEDCVAAASHGAKVVLFPELCVTCYTCSDLFLQQTLLDASINALKTIITRTQTLDALIVVGLPLSLDGALYNCAAVISRGVLLGVVPKRNIPNYTEFYEARHFTRGNIEPREVSPLGSPVPFGSGIVFECADMPLLKVAVEICEDLWLPASPAINHAASGATVMLNPSASDEVIGKAAFRRCLVEAQSAKLICVYAYADAGDYESTTDLIFAGHNIVTENGSIIAESSRFESGITYADVDLQKIDAERRRTTSFKTNCECDAQKTRVERVKFNLNVEEMTLSRVVAKYPFVPSDETKRKERCEEILTMQAIGLASRIKRSKTNGVVLGLSGGLDSTLALLVCVRAMERLSLPMERIIAVTMPGFGTTKRTKGNAERLAEAFGVTLKTIPIKKAVEVHFKDIGQPQGLFDVTYENSQARERTQILMDIANMTNSLVVGTGDLSELALGFATYNGDHMSMYAVNVSIPKTLVRYLVGYEAARLGGSTERTMNDILSTPVSPELLPADGGKISQKTEEIVGPYALHDFFLYYMIRFGFTPSKIARLARVAFKDEFDDATINKWLTVFLRRFFQQQFKRSCLPDGPKVGTVTLSPRGDFRMPSDASVEEWVR